MDTSEAAQLANRYISVWNEADADARRAQIAALWLPDGAHFVGTREVRGHAQLEERVSTSHDKNVRVGGFVFRNGGNVHTLREIVTFNWEMVRPATGEVLAIGLEFLEVDTQGRIRTDYQFNIA